MGCAMRQYKHYTQRELPPIWICLLLKRHVRCRSAPATESLPRATLSCSIKGNQNYINTHSQCQMTVLYYHRRVYTGSSFELLMVRLNIYSCYSNNGLTSDFCITLICISSQCLQIYVSSGKKYCGHNENENENWKNNDLSIAQANTVYWLEHCDTSKI